MKANEFSSFVTSIDESNISVYPNRDIVNEKKLTCDEYCSHVIKCSQSQWETSNDVVYSASYNPHSVYNSEWMTTFERTTRLLLKRKWKHSRTSCDIKERHYQKCTSHCWPLHNSSDHNWALFQIDSIHLTMVRHKMINTFTAQKENTKTIWHHSQCEWIRNGLWQQLQLVGRFHFTECFRFFVCTFYSMEVSLCIHSFNVVLCTVFGQIPVICTWPLENARFLYNRYVMQ